MRIAPPLIALVLLTPLDDGQASQVSLTVTIKGLRNSHGRVGCALWRSADGFPKQPKRAHRRVWTRIERGHATCRFVGVVSASGKRDGSRYAISVMHDENGNGKLDTNFFGVPKEGYGFSRDAKPGLFSPPKFKAARFRLPANATRITITVRY